MKDKNVVKWGNYMRSLYNDPEIEVEDRTMEEMIEWNSSIFFNYITLTNTPRRIYRRITQDDYDPNMINLSRKIEMKTEFVYADTRLNSLLSLMEKILFD